MLGSGLGDVEGVISRLALVERCWGLPTRGQYPCMHALSGVSLGWSADAVMSQRRDDYHAVGVSPRLASGEGFAGLLTRGWHPCVQLQL